MSHSVIITVNWQNTATI